MDIPNGYHPLPPGKIAAVVTYLEMRARPEQRTANDQSLTVQSVKNPDLNWYRDLFRAVGTEWIWFSRLSMDDPTLASIIHDPLVEVYAIKKDSKDIGLLELDFREAGACELAYFGLTADAIGTGAGQQLMQFALARAWSGTPAINRLHVHTCTLDHPRAVGFYRKSGFTPYARAIEVADDPRLDGRLPRDAAAWLPLL
ncbi:MAG: GNAT family N-acetyltransferase [Beijerinckiaceae bacterium]